MTVGRELLTAADPSALAVELVTAAMFDAVERRGRFLIVLAGGRTPLALYRRLAEIDDLPWQRCELLWGDERYLPPDHVDNNGRAVREALSRSAIPPERIRPWPILETPQESAAAYARELTELAGQQPLFDLTLLGLGADCHTAGLFPSAAERRDPSGLTLASRPASTWEPRLSLSAEALSRSRTVLFLVSGERKRLALRALLAPEGDAEECRAREVGALERLLVVSDLNV